MHVQQMRPFLVFILFLPRQSMPACQTYVLPANFEKLMTLFESGPFGYENWERGIWRRTLQLLQRLRLSSLWKRMNPLICFLSRILFFFERRLITSLETPSERQTTFLVRTRFRREQKGHGI